MSHHMGYLTQQCRVSQHCQLCFAGCVNRSGASCHRALWGCITLAVCTPPPPVVVFGIILSLERLPPVSHTFTHPQTIQSTQRLRWARSCYQDASKRLPHKLLFGGFVYLIALGLLSKMLHFVTVKAVAFVGCTGMHRTGCCGVTSLILHVLDS